jgi:hypothetical protein
MRPAFAVAILGALLLSSCLEAQHWPIPQLTVPAGAPPARIPSQFVSPEIAAHLTPDGSSIVEGPRIYSWLRGFNYATGWEALVRHVEGQLTPLGYRPDTQYGQQAIPDIPGVAKGTLARGWVSPDGKFQVLLFNVAFVKDRVPDYVKREDANYILAIDQVKDIPAELQETVNSGGGG